MALYLGNEKIDIVLGDNYNIGSGIYVAQIGKRKFYTVEKALDRAVSGDKVNMIADSQENKVLFIPDGVKLDLNGFTLTAKGMMGNINSHLVDYSEDKTGLLCVPKTNVTLNKNNEQLPVYNGINGYVFSALFKFQYKHTINPENEEKGKSYFLPIFELFSDQYIAQGREISGINVESSIVYTEDNNRIVRYTFSDLTVQGVINSYSPEEGRYKTAYVFNYNLDQGRTYIIVFTMTSDTGVEFSTEDFEPSSVSILD